MPSAGLVGTGKRLTGNRFAQIGGDRTGGAAMEEFVVGEIVNHQVGDAHCPACAEDFPEPCGCGGLVHASVLEVEDPDDNPLITTRCDQCGRSDEDLAEAV